MGSSSEKSKVEGPLKKAAGKLEEGVGQLKEKANDVKEAAKNPGQHKRGYTITIAVISVAVGIYFQRNAIKHSVEPMVQPVLDSMPSFNWTEFQEKHGISMPDMFKKDEKPRPGVKLRELGYKPKHPIIIVPGFVTSGLELWHGKPCANKYFRQRIWGSIGMTQSFMGDKDCWMEHMALNSTDGLDPDGIALRASEGLLGIDYFFPGYAVWAGLIEAAADLGYDTNNLHSETYDWRLSVPNMEKRDSYFTRLKWRIELTHFTEQEKVVVASHSWGDNVFRNFLVWVTEDDPDWVERHIHAYVNIAGPVLGVAKSMTSLLSGETRDTAELGLIGAFLSDSLVPRNVRVKLFRTWGSGLGMLPIGGPAIWGNSTWAPDDTEEMKKQNLTYGAFITETLIPPKDEDDTEEGNDKSDFRDFISNWLDKIRGNSSELEKIVKRHDVDGAVKILFEHAGPQFQEQVVKWGAVHVDQRSCKAGKGSADEYYYNPLKCPLPKAPSMELYCLYGVGIPTERSYYYLNLESEEATGKSGQAFETVEHYVSWQLDEDADKEKHWEQESETAEQYEVRWRLDKDADKEENRGEVDSGVRSADGDGTVGLISTGVMCHKHWRDKRLNPSGIRVVSREFPHEPVAMYKDLRGGPRSADHVDILGHMDVLADVLVVASGRGHELQDKVVSDVARIADNIALDADGCCD